MAEIREPLLVEDPGAEGETAPDGVRYYTTITLLALVAVALPLLARQQDPWAVFPSLVGVLALVLRWRWGPLFVLFSLLWVVIADRVGHNPLEMIQTVLVAILSVVLGLHVEIPSGGLTRGRLDAAVPALDILLAAAVVVYVAAHFRLISLTRNIFPLDRRRRQRLPGEATHTRGSSRRPARGPLLEEKRSPHGIPVEEGSPLLVVASFCACLGQLLWLWLDARDPSEDLSALIPLGVPIRRLSVEVWRCIVLLWFFGTLLIVVTGVLAYLGQRKLSRAEAELYLQDELWRQTRREQSRLSRWLARFRWKMTR
jgi:hypothetical protein